MPADKPAVEVEHQPPAPARPEPEQASWWQDYCPCEESGDPDRILCRNLRGGVQVTPDMMAAGAALRDARKSLDDWERENGSF
jgi:hypothetical protein